jgi:hypothetical protein
MQNRVLIALWTIQFHNFDNTKNLKVRNIYLDRGEGVTNQNTCIEREKDQPFYTENRRRVSTFF